MKTKKILLTVLTVTLLASALLVSGCLDQLEKITENDITEDNYPVPVGKGIARVKISDGKQLTILPNETVANMFFVVTFTGTGATSYNQRFPTTANAAQAYSSSGYSISIPDGDYNVSVSAYNTADTTTGLLIYGWDGSSPYNVDSTSGSATPVNAVLTHKITPSTGRGIFKYDVTVPALPVGTNTNDFAYTDMKLHLYTYNTTNEPTGFPKTLSVGTNPETAGIQIQSGFYSVEIVLKAKHCQDRIIRNVMHIYDGLTSTCTETSIPSPVQKEFTVNFDLKGKTDSTFTDSQLVTNANPIVKPTDPVDAAGLTDFEKWYSDSSLTTQWTFTTLVFSDNITLYAGWQNKAGTGQIDVDIDYQGAAQEHMTLTATPSKPSLSYNDIVGSESITIEAKFTGAAAGNKGTWMFGGIDLSSYAVYDGGSDSVKLVIDNSLSTTILEELAAGTLYIDVSAMVSGEAYGAKVTFSISN
jgi:hypothetical protein